MWSTFTAVPGVRVRCCLLRMNQLEGWIVGMLDTQHPEHILYLYIQNIPVTYRVSNGTEGIVSRRWSLCKFCRVSKLLQKSQKFRVLCRKSNKSHKYSGYCVWGRTNLTKVSGIVRRVVQILQKFRVLCEELYKSHKVESGMCAKRIQYPRYCREAKVPDALCVL